MELETIQIRRKSPEELAQMLVDSFYKANPISFSTDGKRPVWENLKQHDRTTVFQAASIFFMKILDNPDNLSETPASLPAVPLC